MGIQNVSVDVLLVTLPKGSHLDDEIETVNGIVSEDCEHDVIIDFSRVEMLTSESICSLMILNKYLSGFGHQLVLYSVPSEIQHIFSRTGLEVLFTFADDEYDALQTVRRASCLYG